MGLWNDAQRDALARSRGKLLLAGVLALAAAFAASVFLSRGLVQPILEIQQAAQRIGTGNLTVRVRSDRQDELGDVARAVEAMVAGLRATVGRVAQAADGVEATSTSIARITEQNLITVPPGVIEAARSMGASRTRIAATVLVPEALAPVILGFTFAFVAIVDMSAVAGLVAGGGLGAFAQTFGYRQYDPAVTWVCVIILVAIVQVVQFAGNALAARILSR